MDILVADIFCSCTNSVLESGQLNPWGLLTLQHDFDNPAASVLEAARELWRLAEANQVDIPGLLRQVKPDSAMAALDAYYANQLSSNQPQPKDPNAQTN